MRLYACGDCNAVFAFDLFDIRKHDLEIPEHKTCPVCRCRDAFHELMLDNQTESS